MITSKISCFFDNPSSEIAFASAYFFKSATFHFVFGVSDREALRELDLEREPLPPVAAFEFDGELARLVFLDAGL